MSAQTQYRDMTEAQMLEWGRIESATRHAELSVRGAEGLKAAQDGAERRRKLIGATRDQAADLVIQANRYARRSAA